jgi:tetratricopeptide (TPR) repeat protein
LTAVLFTLLVTSNVLSQEADKALLREAARTPTLTICFGIGFNTAEGLVLPSDPQDKLAEIAALEKALQGTLADAASYLRLSRLYRDKQQADAACNKAVELYRQQVKAQPDNARLRAELGLALHATEKNEEAETLLRQAAQDGARDWCCQLALGRLLTDQAFDILLPGGGNVMQLLDTSTVEKIGTQAIQSAQHKSEQALHYFSHAVELAPRQPEVWSKLAAARFCFGFLQGALLLRDGKAVNPLVVVLSEELLGDLRKLTEVSSTDHRAVGVLIFAEVGAFVFVNPEKAKAAKSIMAALPETTQRSVEKSVRRLEELTRQPDHRAAAGAAEVLSFIQWFTLADKRAAEVSARRATELDATRQLPWELLAVILGDEDRHKEAADLCLARLAQKDCVHNRLVAARAFEDLRDFARAEEHVRAGLKQEPDHLECNLALAALLLRHDDATALAEAGRRLDTVEKLFKDSTAANIRNDYFATRGLFLALSGDLRGARELFLDVLARDSKHRTAHKAIAALGP